VTNQIRAWNLPIKMTSYGTSSLDATAAKCCSISLFLNRVD